MIKAVIFDLDGVIAISNQRFSDTLRMSQELQDEFFKGKFQDLLVGNGDLKKNLGNISENAELYTDFDSFQRKLSSVLEK